MKEREVRACFGQIFKNGEILEKCWNCPDKAICFQEWNLELEKKYGKGNPSLREEI